MTEPTFLQRRQQLMRYAWLSVAASVLVIGLKVVAWWLTDSVGLLSDALESTVNLIAAVFALIVLGIAAMPADKNHPFGHTKAEYFSSGLEGGLILLAASLIAVSAIDRLLNPVDVTVSMFALACSGLASLINLAVALVLMRVGKREDSIALEADGHHLLTDVWTSVGVMAGVGLVFITGWQLLDPIIALAVAAQITWTGITVFKRSVMGLMDSALPEPEQEKIRAVLDRHRKPGQIDFHALRTRKAASRRFVSVHVLVPGHWDVTTGHRFADDLEHELRALFEGLVVITHLEPIDDPRSYQDIDLDRLEP